MGNLKVGDVIASNRCGDFVVKKIRSFKDVEIEFLYSGYTCSVYKQAAINGSVRDPWFPQVCGVGFVGVGEFFPGKKGGSAYTTWHSMLSRCYQEKALIRNPSYRGRVVCDEWLNFQNFARWYRDNYKSGCFVSLVFLDESRSVYSPETCSFEVADEVKSRASWLKDGAYRYSLIDPHGKTHHITNLSEFCRVNGLIVSSIRSVISGSRKSCKGWRVNDSVD